MSVAASAFHMTLYVRVCCMTLPLFSLLSDVDDVHDMMDDISEQNEIAEEIGNALSAPIGFNQELDEVGEDLDHDHGNGLHTHTHTHTHTNTHTHTHTLTQTRHNSDCVPINLAYML